MGNKREDITHDIAHKIVNISWATKEKISLLTLPIK